MSMPAQTPGRSRQDYETPREFLAEAKFYLGIDEWQCDLAASPENAVCPRFITEEEDALVTPWPTGDGWNWCNPPFADIEPWVQRAWEETQRHKPRHEPLCRVAMLVPAAVGANWWRDWVHEKADVLLLNGRLSFDGKAPYPKDTALLLYAHQPSTSLGYEVWDWRHWRD